MESDPAPGPQTWVSINACKVVFVLFVLLFLFVCLFVFLFLDMCCWGFILSTANLKDEFTLKKTIHLSSSIRLYLTIKSGEVSCAYCSTVFLSVCNLSYCPYSIFSILHHIFILLSFLYLHRTDHSKFNNSDIESAFIFKGTCPKRLTVINLYIRSYTDGGGSHARSQPAHQGQHFLRFVILPKDAMT